MENSKGPKENNTPAQRVSNGPAAQTKSKIRQNASTQGVTKQTNSEDEEEWGVIAPNKIQG